MYTFILDFCIAGVAMPKEKYESPNPRRTHTLMSPEDVAAGKKSVWYELEITGDCHSDYYTTFHLVFSTID